jgi:dipeptidyl aminopeptidase/acylaminoacyl peptidase
MMGFVLKSSRDLVRRLGRTSGGLFVAFAVIAAAIPDEASAQYFGRNKVQYETFDFKILQTPHFNVHFYPEEADAVEDAARMSERWYERFARLFQHEFEQPKPLILYADHPDFQQTNTLRGSISEGTGGVTESLKNRVIMPLGSSYWDTDHVLGHELVHAFQYNIAQSRSGTGLRGLSLLPLWLVEGMAEYLSVGREDALTAMWMRDAIRRSDLPTIQQLTQGSKFFPYRFGQALWAYIGGRYGDEAVVDVYRRSLRVGWEPALRQVLGTTSDSLSIGWRNSISEEYLPLMAGKQAPSEVGAVLLSPATGSGKQNVSPSVSPDGRFVAFLSEKDLFSIDLFIADARTGEVIRKLVSANSDPHFDALRFVDSSGDWSPDGSRFVFSVTAEGDNELAIVNVESGEIESKIDIEEVGSITNPTWSPDGRLIAFTGMHGGVSDLFTYNVETEEVLQVTDDKYADMQPAWSPDGTTIAFATDRGMETDFGTLTFGKTRLGLVNVDTGDVEVLDIFGNVKHMNPQYAPNGRSLYFISDQDGFSDIYQYTFGSEDLRRITRIATGVSGITSMSPAMSVSEEAGSILFSVFDKREFHIYSLAAGEADAGGVTVAVTADPKPGRLLTPTAPRRTSRIATYLADEETGLVPPGTYKAEDAVNYDSSLSLDYIGQPTLGVGTNRFGANIGGGAAAFFSDMLGNRSAGVLLQANGTFKDVGGQGFYLNQEKRLNWGVAGGRIPYLQGFQRFGVDEETNTPFIGLIRQRIFVSSTNFITAYPFSTTRRVEASVGMTRYSYDLEEDRFFLNGNGQVFNADRINLGSRPALNLATASIALVGDNSFMGFTSPVSGGRFRFELGQTMGTENFTMVLADYRRYFSPSNVITFAVRGQHIARYGNELDPNFQSGSAIQPYFLGFETLIRGYAFESFERQECDAARVEAGAVIGGQFDCPGLDRLMGHKIGVINAEFRIPVLGTERFGLLNFPFLPTEFVIFGDAGLAWNNFSDVDLVFERTGARRVPVFSAGVSARFNIMGIFILESYYAYPFQRPNKGWHWGFALLPGGY